MGRLLAIAVALAVVAGVVTAALGGVSTGGRGAVGARPAARDVPGAAVPPEQAGVARSRTAVRDASATRVGGTVRMRRLQLIGGNLTIPAGEGVRFVNRDDVAHDLVALGSGGYGSTDFRSGTIARGATFTTPPLRHPGTYPYVCLLHPTVMHGTITVR